MKLRNRVLLVVLFVAMIWFVPNVVQADYEYENLKYVINTETDEITITGVTDKTITNIVIPDTIDGKSVTSIGNNAFYECNNLVSIVIPNSMKYVGIKAFYGCSSLTSIEIPDGVTGIGNQAFRECASLVSIKIPEGQKSIGDCDFYNCASLISIEIPNSVTQIGIQAFYGCSSLTSIKIPNGIINIRNQAFSGCSNLKNITIPETVTSIENYAFYECNDLESIIIPNTVKFIGIRAFYGCRSLTSIKIPNEVTSIDSATFYGCSSLTSIEIPNEVTSIGNSAFEECENLKSIKISDSLINIGENAFSRCSSLTSIDIPTSINNIGKRAFYDCRSLTSIKIPNGVTSIEDWTFGYCSSLKNIEIPNSVTQIGDYAFYYCYNITNIVIPNSVTNIEDNTFYGCNQNLIIFVDRDSYAENYFMNTKFNYKYDVNNVLMKDCTIGDIETQQYTGTEIKPNIVLEYDNNILTQEEDYILSYEENIEVGTAVVRITGRGNYVGKVTVEFKIIRKDISNCTIEEIEDQEYTGIEIKPDVVIKDGEKTLTKDVDYELLYCDFINPGTATITITGIGNYTGRVEEEFKIKDSYIESLMNMLPDTMQLDIPEVEFEKAKHIVKTSIEEIWKNNGINVNKFEEQGIELSIIASSIYTNEFYNAFINLERFTIEEDGNKEYNSSKQKNINLTYNNTSNHNATDESYVKNLEIKSPKYYTINLEYFNNDIEKFVEEILIISGEYYTNLINDDSIVIKTGIGAGGGNVLNWETGEGGTAIAIFKNGILYDIRLMGHELFIPIINVPSRIRDNELINYITNIIEPYYQKRNTEITNIQQGNTLNIQDGYTVYTKDENEYIVVKGENKNISECIIGDIDNQTYTGKELKPSLVIKDGDYVLEEDTDYELSYSNNTEVGTATVTITGIGNYTGEITKEFKISYEEELEEALKIMNSIPSTIHVKLTASEQIDKIFNGKDYYIYAKDIEDEIYLPDGYSIKLLYEDYATLQHVWVWLYHNGEKFPYSSYRNILGDEYEYRGYTVEYKDTINKNSTTNEKVEQFISKLMNDEDKFSNFEHIEDLSNGIPDSVMKRANEQIINDIKSKSDIDNLEIKIIYINNDLNTSDDEYKGLYYRLAFFVNNVYYDSIQGLQKFVELEKTNINKLTITGITDKTYTGKEIQQNIVVKDENTILKENTDYTVSYKNNKNVGTATVTITGTGNYTGTKELTFKINKATYDMSKVKFENLTVTYDGKSHKITATGLPTGVTVTYKNNDKTNVGTYTVTAVFTGDTTNYNTISDMTATLKINAKNISSTSISSVGNQTYTGKDIKPSVVVKDGNTTLKNGTDYTVSHTNHQNTGKATITITGKGNYTGTKTTTYRIIPSQVTNLKTKSQKEKEITLQWSKNGGNVTGYKVYQYNSKTKKWDYVGKTSNTNYTIKKLTAGTTYSFKVRAYKTIDGTQYFGSYSSKLNASTLPSATKLKTLSTKNRKVTVKWNKVSGATGYEIYMSTSKNKGYSKIKTITKPSTVSYTKGSLKKNKTYYFKIRTYRTVNGKKIYSSYSNIKQIKVK